MPARPPLAAPLLFALIWAGMARASEGPPPKLDPTTYRSPSGEFVLHLDPTREDGGGPGEYRLMRGGTEVWAKTLPFTFWEAGVADDGTAAGYAYTEGFRDIGAEGAFVAAVLAPDGEPRAVHAVPRTRSRFFHTPPNPLAAGTFLHPGRDRFVVRLADEDVNVPDETWRAFPLSDGAALPDVRPNAWVAGRAGRWSVVDAAPVRGTPLLLTHWHLLTDLDRRVSKMGGAFTVTDPAGAVVWSAERPGDYEAPAGENRWSVRRRVMEEGAILPATGDGRFAVWFVKEGVRAEFAAARGPDGQWAVTDRDRTPYDGPAAEPAADPAAAAEPIDLPFLGSIVFGPAPAVAAVRAVGAFDLDDRGRIGFVRGGLEDDPETFVLIDAESGAVLREVTPPGLADMEAHRTLLAWTGGDGWALVAGESRPDGACRAWRVDAAAGSAAPLPAFDAPGLTAIDGFGDGGFAGLVERDGGSATTEWLARFAADGRTLWRVRESYENPAHVFSPSDVAVSAAGRVGVVSAVGEDVRVFSADGEHLRTDPLEPWLGRKASYPSNLSDDGAIPEDGDEGGDRWVLHDFLGTPPVVRLGPGGAVRGGFAPRFADGRGFDVGPIVRSPADGRLWTTDGTGLMRLGADGGVDRTLGAAPDAAVLDEIAAVAVGPGGDVFAVDARTGAVHVFGPDGARRRVLRPEPGDFPRRLFLPDLSIAPDGSAYLSEAFALGSDEYVRFAPSGDRTGRVPAGEGATNGWRFRPDGGRWVCGYESAALFAADGGEVRTVRRRPGGDWLRPQLTLAVFPDGGAAIADAAGVHLYDPAGAPVRTLPLPYGRSVAAAADWVAVAAGGAAVLAPRSGGPPRRFAPPGLAGDREAPPVTLLTDPAGRELWLHRHAARRLDRYALPAE